jgi:hypothetical protein
MAVARGSRAFVLLSTMLVIMVLGLVLRVAILRMPSILGSARQSVYGDVAERAAESGIQYAVSQLREDPTWVGGIKRNEVVVDQPGLKVVQDHGNVIGTITGEDGLRSEFRIRFNYQDGDASDAGDARPDPSAEFSFKSPFVCVNNIDQEVEAVVPRGTGDNASVVDPEVGPYTTPEKSVCLIVEGRALTSEGSVVASEVKESVYLLMPYRAVDDAVIMAGGGLNVTVGSTGKVRLRGSNVKLASDKRLRLRSKAGVEVTHGNEAAPVVLREGTKAEIRRDAAAGLTATYDDKKVAVNQENFGDGQDFYSVPWSQISKTEDHPIKIPGGTYVYGKSLDPARPTGREIRYYDMSYDDYINQSPEFLSDPSKGVVVKENLSNLRDPANVTASQKKDGEDAISVKPVALKYWDPVKGDVMSYPGFQWAVKGKDLQVTPSKVSGATGLAVVPRALPKINPDDQDYPASTDPHNPDSMKIVARDTTMVAAGDFQLRGGMVGEGGTLISEGDITIVSGRVMSLVAENRGRRAVEREFEEMTMSAAKNQDETIDEGGAELAAEGRDSSLMLNLYSKGDITLSSYVERRDAYRNLSFKGLLYSWGDVKVSAGFGQDDSRTRGLFYLHGSLVAYGNDPESAEPGMARDESGSAKGKVSIDSLSANLYWDPRFLPAIAELQPEGSSFFTLERSLVSYPSQ